MTRTLNILGLLCLLLLGAIGGAGAQTLSITSYPPPSTLPQSASLVMYLAPGQGLATDSAGANSIGKLGTLSGQSIAYWGDSSGHGNNAIQTTAANDPLLAIGTFGLGPLNYRSGLTWPSASAALSAPAGLTLGTTWTIMTIYMPQPGNSRAVYNSNYLTYIGQGVTPICYINGVAIAPPGSAFPGGGGTWPGGQFICQTVTDNATSVTNYYNAVSIATATAPANFGPVVVGSNATPTNGPTLAVLVWNVALTQTEVGAAYKAFRTYYSPNNRVLCTGNSITYGAVNGDRASFVPILDALVRPRFPYVTFVNEGISGQATGSMISAINNLQQQFDDFMGGDIVLFSEGTNALGTGVTGAGAGISPSTQTAYEQAVFNDIVLYGQYVLAGGAQEVLWTILPLGPTSQSSLNCEQGRQDVNAAIRALYKTGGTYTANGITFTASGAFATAVADVAADPLIGQANQNTNTTYYNPDRLHPNQLGDQRIANIIAPVLMSLMTNPVSIPFASSGQIKRGR